MSQVESLIGEIHMLRYQLARLTTERDAAVCAATPLRDLPRRGDEDLHEATDTPVFLIQSGSVRTTDECPCEWSDEEECLMFDGERYDDQRLLDCGWGFILWTTEYVGFTRAECQRWCNDHSYRGRLRVYSVPAQGELRTLINAFSATPGILAARAAKGNDNDE